MKQDTLAGKGTAARAAARRTRVTASAVAAVVGLVGLTLGQAAGAGCPTYAPHSQDKDTAHFSPVVYRPDSLLAGAFVYASNVSYESPSIVGLWKVEFIAKGNTNGIPDGALIDFGTATWHEDGTEEMVSGGRNPTTGDVCMGVWQQVGRATFKLAHVALAWQSGAYVGPATIVERVTVDGTGSTFQGTFTITQYVASMAPGMEFDESTVVPPTPITGVITGTRVTVN